MLPALLRLSSSVRLLAALLRFTRGALNYDIESGGLSAALREAEELEAQIG